MRPALSLKRGEITFRLELFPKGKAENVVSSSVPSSSGEKVLSAAKRMRGIKGQAVG